MFSEDAAGARELYFPRWKEDGEENSELVITLFRMATLARLTYALHRIAAGDTSALDYMYSDIELAKLTATKELGGELVKAAAQMGIRL